ncbi:hypothetical protein ACC666_36405, partial [Rhizobium johnstonii]
MDMSSFRNAVVSLPGKELVAKTPFGAMIVIHATAADIEGPEHNLLSEGEEITQRFESALIEQFALLKVTHCD